MHKTKVGTFNAIIYVELRAKYKSHSHTIRYSLAFDFIQEYCDRVGLCVTVTETTFIYTKGREPGIIVGLINYPRFPKDPEDIKNIALDLANKLKHYCNQNRVSIVFPDETIMLGAKE